MSKAKHVILGVILAVACCASVGTFLWTRSVAHAYSLKDIIVEPAPPQAPQPAVPSVPVDPRLNGLEDRGDGARLFLAPASDETILRAGFADNGSLIITATNTAEKKRPAYRIYTLALKDKTLGSYLASADAILASPQRPVHHNADALCYAKEARVFDIWCANMAGEDPWQLTQHNGGEDLTNATISPDGDWVAFEANTDRERGPKGSAIWKIGMNRSGIAQLTRNADDRAPAWSSDGQTLYFQRRMPDGDWDVYQIDADGSNPAPILQTPGQDEMWPSDAGDHAIVIAVRSKDEAPRIEKLDTVTKKRTLLTSGAHGPETYPSVSPDGKLVSFLAPVDPADPSRLGVWLTQMPQ